MQWLLVMIVSGSPIKTDLYFPTIRECLQAEQQAAAEYAKAYNETMGWAKTTQPAKDYESIENLARTMSHRGTCIPAAK
jgi:hypothetical protein